MIILRTEMSKLPDGLIFLENYITEEDEKNMYAMMEENEWVPKENRLVQQYNFSYSYVPPYKLKSAPVAPEILKTIANTLPALESNGTLNAPNTKWQIIINRYLKGEGISPHIDHVKLFSDKVYCITLGSPATMRFTCDAEKYDLVPSNRSMYVMTEDARYKWKHQMMPLKHGTRYSITFRAIKEK